MARSPLWDGDEWDALSLEDVGSKGSGTTRVVLHGTLPALLRTFQAAGSTRYDTMECGSKSADSFLLSSTACMA